MKTQSSITVMECESSISMTIERSDSGQWIVMESDGLPDHCPLGDIVPLTGVLKALTVNAVLVTVSGTKAFEVERDTLDTPGTTELLEVEVESITVEDPDTGEQVVQIDRKDLQKIGAEFLTDAQTTALYVRED